MNQIELIRSVTESTNLSHRKIAGRLGISHTLFNKYAVNEKKMPEALFIVLEALKHSEIIKKQLKKELELKSHQFDDIQEMQVLLWEDEQIIENYVNRGHLKYYLKLFDGVDVNGKEEFVVTLEKGKMITDNNEQLLSAVNVNHNEITSIEIGNMIKYVIKELNFTQKNVAQLSAISQSRLNEIISGDFKLHSNNSIENIKLIARAMDINPKYFIYNEFEREYFLFMKVMMYGQCEREVMNFVHYIFQVYNSTEYLDYLASDTRYRISLIEDHYLSYADIDVIETICKGINNKLQGTDIPLSDLKVIYKEMADYYNDYMFIKNLIIDNSLVNEIINILPEIFTFKVYSTLLDVILYKDIYGEKINIAAFEHMYYRDGAIKNKNTDDLLSNYDGNMKYIYESVLDPYRLLGNLTIINLNFDIREMLSAQAAQVTRKIIIEIENFEEAILKFKDSMDKLILSFIEMNYIESMEYKEYEDDNTRNKRMFYNLIMKKIDLIKVKEEDER
ncbi:helix-turn-helix domain-containing protein [Macrococcoides canis]|uniref:helix-turn-helix domain-containing protein n=1 Tax=Macrococcoides canis TaxID=1855823 RepID=UPI0010FC1E17|nr:helix-turn-helix transcriptional regulator [Macrococcus canis]QCT74185.1 XRE family transcriptional regulator [Macrococcus canis]